MRLQVIDHVGLNVRNLETSYDFYQRLFGFEVFHRWTTTWLIQKGELKIGLFQRPNAVPVCDLDQAIAITHVAFRTDRAGFEEAQKELIRLGVSFDPPEDTGVALALFLLDPDGHQIEITTFDWDTPPAETKAAKLALNSRRECCRPRSVRS